MCVNQFIYRFHNIKMFFFSQIRFYCHHNPLLVTTEKVAVKYTLDVIECTHILYIYEHFIHKNMIVKLLVTHFTLWNSLVCVLKQVYTYCRGHVTNPGQCNKWSLCWRGWTSVRRLTPGPAFRDWLVVCRCPAASQREWVCACAWGWSVSISTQMDSTPHLNYLLHRLQGLLLLLL